MTIQADRSTPPVLTSLRRRAVLAKPSRPDPGIVYPPYSARALKLMRKLF